jgi:hypothetical protein
MWPLANMGPLRFRSFSVSPCLLRPLCHRPDVPPSFSLLVDRRTRRVSRRHWTAVSQQLAPKSLSQGWGNLVSIRGIPVARRMTYTFQLKVTLLLSNSVRPAPWHVFCCRIHEIGVQGVGGCTGIQCSLCEVREGDCARQEPLVHDYRLRSIVLPSLLLTYTCRECLWICMSKCTKKSHKHPRIVKKVHTAIKLVPCW